MIRSYLDISKADKPSEAVWLAVLVDCMRKSVDRLNASDDEARVFDAALTVGILLGHYEAHYEAHGLNVSGDDLFDKAGEIMERGDTMRPGGLLC